MSSTGRTDTGNAIRAALVSPSEIDSNLEPANVVDGLFAIARAISGLSDAVRDHTRGHAGQAGKVSPALGRISHGDVDGATA